MSTYLQHHGILGQKWGKRNGPPYPLSAKDHKAVTRASEYFNENKQVESWTDMKVDELFHPFRSAFSIKQWKRKGAINRITRRWKRYSPEQQQEILDMMPSNIRDNWNKFVKDNNTEQAVIAGVAIADFVLRVIRAYDGYNSVGG